MERIPYIIIQEENTLGERPPLLCYMMLNADEYKIMAKVVEEFEMTRAPYYHPRMGIYKLTLRDSIEEVTNEIKNEIEIVKEWKEKLERRKEKGARDSFLLDP